MSLPVEGVIIAPYGVGPKGPSGLARMDGVLVSGPGSFTVDLTTYQEISVDSTGGAISLSLSGATAGQVAIIKDVSGTANTNSVTITDATNISATFETPDLNAPATSVSYFTKGFGVIYRFDGTNWKLLASQNCPLIIEAAGGGSINSGPNGGINLIGNGATDETGVTPAIHWRTTESVNAPGATTARINVSPKLSTYGYWVLTVRDGALGSTTAKLALDSLTGSHLAHCDGGFAISTFDANWEPTVVVSLTLLGAAGFQASGPIKPATYTILTLPTASIYTGAQIFVSDERGGATICYSDGTNWRRCYDNAVAS